MKKWFSLLLLGIGITNLNAQNTFQIDYNVGLLDLMGSVHQNSSDGYLVSGMTSAGFNINGVLYETDDAGTLVWSKDYNGGFLSPIGFFDARETTGGYIATGSATSGSEESFIMRTDGTGNVVWSNIYGGPNNKADYGNKIKETSDGGYIMVGGTQSFGPTDSTNVYVVKVDGAGNMQWDIAIRPDPTRDSNHDAKDVVEVPGDGYYVTGYTSEIFGPDTLTDILLFKLDLSGNLIWIDKYGADNDYDEGYSISLLPGNELLITGYTDATVGFLDAGDVCFLRTNLSGTLLSSSAYDMGFADISNSGQLTSDGHYLSIGWTIKQLFPLQISAYLLKVNSGTGAVMLAQQYTAGIGTLMSEGQETSDGGYVIGSMAGTTGWNYHVVKTDGSAISNCLENSYGAVLRAYSPPLAIPAPATHTGSIERVKTPTVANITPVITIDCINVICTPPTDPSGSSASPNPICAGQSTTITGAGSDPGVTYYVYDAPTGGTNLGAAPLSVSPGTTTTYYIEAVDPTLCSSTNREAVTVTVIPVDDPSWTAPGTQCETGGSIDLTTYITGTTGGTFSGTGVIGNNFNPATAGAGTHTITYSVGSVPCVQTQNQNITVEPDVDPSWTAPGTQCEAGGLLDLTTFITGTTGGTFSGTGVSGNNFNPATAGAGTHTITYTVGNVPCQETQNQSITVEPDVDPSWTAPATQCETGGMLDLTTLITGTTGGTFSGTGVSGNNFNPATAGAGTYTITYTVGNAPCQETQNQSITVEPDVDPSWTAPGIQCETGSAIDLTTFITGTTGGTFSGTGVSGNNFDPGVSGGGTFTITYTVGNAPCQETQNQNITVEPDVDPTWTNPGVLCETGAPVDLSAYITGTTGGTFSGTAITGNNFDPSAAGAGTFTITYTVGNAPCQETFDVDIDVISNPDPSWTAPTTQCEAGSPIDLTTFITGTTGGTFSGTGVAGNNFDPASSGPGTFTITYTVGSVPCVQTQNQSITVEPDVDPSWTAPSTQCETGGLFDLTTLITGTTGGTFSGTGVSGNNFNPATAGAGTFTITYTVGNAPCQETQNQSITVEPDVDPSWTAPSTQCETGGAIDLTTFITGTTGGTFSGTGVAGNNFDPGVSGGGTFTITYTVGNAPCQETQNQNITVEPDVDPTWTNPGVLCETGAPVDLSAYITGTTGGTFSGTAISGNNFDPSTAGAGTFTITYTVGNAPCQETFDVDIDVISNPDPSWTAPTTQCEAGSSIDLTTFITGTPGGTFSGTGVSGNNFDPASSGPGTFTITYTVGSVPCVQTQNQSITVEPDVDPSWTAPSTQCETGGLLDLTTLITGTTGGAFSGTGVSGNNFDPGVSGGGTFTITYTVGNAPCQETQNQSITVEPDVDPAWTSPGTICEGAGSIDLSTFITGTTGGTFSGTGVSGNMFDPTGLSGGITVTYSVGNSPCDETQNQTITVEPDVDPSWNSPGAVCESLGPIDLSTLITGTPGGTWSGTGVSGNMFDPTGLSGSINITYTVGTAPCEETLMQSITVTGAVSAAWTTPGTICEAAGVIDLTTFITGNTGGTWSGTGVSGNMFDPTGLSGTITVTYDVGVVPCNDSENHDIIVEPDVDPSWNSPGSVCEIGGTIDLSTLVTGTPGGTWSGTGVSGNTFDPTGLTGSTISITYTVGNAPCVETSVQTIDVTNITGSWTSPGTMCESDGTINLDALITGTTGGTWSGSGVSGSTFDPVGQSGAVNITYTVGTVPCQDIVMQTITVNVSPVDPTVSATNSTICAGDTTTILATGGGGGITYNIYDAPGGTLLGTTPMIFGPSTTTTYYVESEDVNGCVNLGGGQPVTITVNPLPNADAGVSQTICLGDSADLTATGGGNYVWSTTETTANITVYPGSGTWYYVTVTDANTCSATDSVFVDVTTPGSVLAADDAATTDNVTPITINAGSNDAGDVNSIAIITPPANGSAVVTGGGNVDYTPNTGYVGPDSIQYVICDPFCLNACDTAWIRIEVIDEVQIEVSTGLSPNFDGMNDYWIITGLEKYPDHVVQIYNRWGDLIYEAAPYNNDWSGQNTNASLVISGDEVVDGTYFYVIDLGDGTSDILRGSIELRRK